MVEGSQAFEEVTTQIKKIEAIILENLSSQEVQYILNLFDIFSSQYPGIDESDLVFLVEQQFVIDALSQGKILPTPSSYKFLAEQVELRQKFLGRTSYEVPYTTFNKTNSSLYNWLNVPIQFVLGIFAAFINLLIGASSAPKNEDISSLPIIRP